MTRDLRCNNGHGSLALVTINLAILQFLTHCHSEPLASARSAPRAREESAVRRDKRHYVYILASKSHILYVGVTGSLMARVLQHKSGECEGFTRRYKVDRLVYYEVFQYVNNAIARETEIKKWRREKKIALFEVDNPTWEDLAVDWGKPVVMAKADSSPAEAGSE
jgi:putative endonuclease